MTRLPVSEQAFERWMQGVEDRLKQLRRDIRRPSASLTGLTVSDLTASHVQIGADPSAVIEPRGGGIITIGAVLVTPQLGVTNMEPASTPGTVVGRVLLVDEAGAALGYLPVYDTIT